MMLHELEILDLCAGTGSISMEFLSREAGHVTAVDSNYNCVRHIQTMAREFNCEDEIVVVKSDILRFLEKTQKQFDIIFADPPYAYAQHEKIVEIVYERSLLKENGILIVEHGKETSLENITHFDFLRTYGNVYFSFFKSKPKS